MSFEEEFSKEIQGWLDRWVAATPPYGKAEVASVLCRRTRHHHQRHPQWVDRVYVIRVKKFPIRWVEEKGRNDTTGLDAIDAFFREYGFRSSACYQYESHQSFSRYRERNGTCMFEAWVYR